MAGGEGTTGAGTGASGAGVWGGEEAQAASKATKITKIPVCKLRCIAFQSLCNNQNHIVQDKGKTMTRPTPWAGKIAALIKANNVAAALAQIKVAPSVRELQQLERMVDAHAGLVVDRRLLEAIADQLQALSHPRLHRSP